MDYQMIINPNCCAVLERTADDIPVGRCWFHLKDGVCPRHGDVKAVQDHYLATGNLTDERDIVRFNPPAEPHDYFPKDGLWSRYKKWW